MSQQLEKVLAVSFVVVLIVAAWATTTWLSAPPPSAIPGSDRRVAPDFTQPLLSGPDFVLSDHRGKVVILDFWATWCAPCEVQMPVLDAVWKTRGQAAANLMIVGLSVDTDPPADVAAWIEERDFTYPIALADHDLAMRYGVMGYPTLLIIDPEGGIHTQHVGVLSRPELEDILDEIAREGAGRG